MYLVKRYKRNFMKILFKKGRFAIIFAWYDQWIGHYRDVAHKTSYLILIPCIVFRFEGIGNIDEPKHSS